MQSKEPPKTELRARQERTNPNALILPLDWEKTVVNYDASAELNQVPKEFQMPKVSVRLTEEGSARYTRAETET